MYSGTFSNLKTIIEVNKSWCWSRDTKIDKKCPTTICKTHHQMTNSNQLHKPYIKRIQNIFADYPDGFSSGWAAKWRWMVGGPSRLLFTINKSTSKRFICMLFYWYEIVNFHFTDSFKFKRTDFPMMSVKCSHLRLILTRGMCGELRGRRQPCVGRWYKDSTFLILWAIWCYSTATSPQLMRNFYQSASNLHPHPCSATLEDKITKLY